MFVAAAVVSVALAKPSCREGRAQLRVSVEVFPHTVYTSLQRIGVRGIQHGTGRWIASTPVAVSVHGDLLVLRRINSIGIYFDLAGPCSLLVTPQVTNPSFISHAIKPNRRRPAKGLLSYRSKLCLYFGCN